MVSLSYNPGEESDHDQTLNCTKSLNAFQELSDRWLIKLNINKCN